MVYLPLAQMSDVMTRFSTGNLPIKWTIRTKSNPFVLKADIERELRAASGGLPVAHIRSMEQVVGEATARDRFNMILLSLFAALALLLGSIGVYGLMAYAVQHRTQEIGIRIALGARPRDVRMMVTLEGIAPSADRSRAGCCRRPGTHTLDEQPALWCAGFGPGSAGFHGDCVEHERAGGDLHPGSAGHTSGPRVGLALGMNNLNRLAGEARPSPGDT
jgi:hypothetical protein